MALSILDNRYLPGTRMYKCMFNDYSNIFFFRPVVVTDAADSWPAIKWTKDFFLKKYSNDTVMVKVNLVSLNNTPRVTVNRNYHCQS